MIETVVKGKKIIFIQMFTHIYFGNQTKVFPDLN
jgi:hypothetical protein